MTISQILETEKENYRDHLYSMADMPLDGADDKLAKLFGDLYPDEGLAELQINHIEAIREALMDSEIEVFYPGFPPDKNSDYTIWLYLGEVEVPADLIEPAEREDVTIVGDFAYIYVGYGIMFRFNPKVIKEITS